MMEECIKELFNDEEWAFLKEFSEEACEMVKSFPMKIKDDIMDAGEMYEQSGD